MSLNEKDLVAVGRLWRRGNPKARYRLRRVRSSKLLCARSGSVVVVSVHGDVMTVRCDCGRVVQKPVTYFYQRNITCGSRCAHWRKGQTVGTSPYLREWHQRHAVCPGWATPAALAAGVGARPVGHVLALFGGAATCGTCETCLATSAHCNARWIAGGRTGGKIVTYEGETMTRAEAARRIGISRQAAASREYGQGDPLRPKDST